MPNCRNCQEPIKFARLGATTIPVDAESDPHEGTLVLFRANSLLMARPARLPRDYGRSRHRHHFDTCKARHRKDRP